MKVVYRASVVERACDLAVKDVNADITHVMFLLKVALTHPMQIELDRDDFLLLEKYLYT